MSRPWWDGSVIYEIYPRAFADANGDQVGDLPGAVGHLDHVGPHGLDVDAVWLTPFFPSGGVDGGYDVTDYTAVAPEYGTLADVDRLVARAHERGVRVLLDLVVGHTSDRHPWFVAARSSRADPHRSWYLWADSRPGGGPPTNWVAEFGGPAWTEDAVTGQWFHHSFYRAQPDLNWRSPAVRSAMADVMRFWLDRGVDGFRVDAIQYTVKDRRLRDNPPARPPRPPWSPEPGGLRRRWSLDQRGVAGVIRGLRRVADAYPEAVLLGELYAPAQRVAAALGGTRADGFHLAMAHQIADGPWDAGAFRRAIAAAERHLPPPLAPTWAFSNHDRSRSASRWGLERARLAALVLLTLRGAVCLYQGEEIGMLDDARPGPWSTHDPYGRDKARAPFDWSEAARQQADPTSLLALYRELIRLRRRSPALRHGTLRMLAGQPPGVVAYERRAGRERLLVVANMADHPVRIQLPAGSRPEAVLGTAFDRPPYLAGNRLDLMAGEGVILRVG
jgi:alpha-glucosidase